MPTADSCPTMLVNTTLEQESHCPLWLPQVAKDPSTWGHFREEPSFAFDFKELKAREANVFPTVSKQPKNTSSLGGKAQMRFSGAGRTMKILILAAIQAQTFTDKD